MKHLLLERVCIFGPVLQPLILIYFKVCTLAAKQSTLNNRSKINYLLEHPLFKCLLTRVYSGGTQTWGTHLKKHSSMFAWMSSKMIFPSLLRSSSSVYFSKSLRSWPQSTLWTHFSISNFSPSSCDATLRKWRHPAEINSPKKSLHRVKGSYSMKALCYMKYSD